jgi:hypothetical protein
MRPTYMKHAQHGAHVAYDQGEIDRCIKNGWVVADEQPDGAPVPEKARVVGVDTDGDGVIDQVFKRKPGRPKGK